MKRIVSYFIVAVACAASVYGWNYISWRFGSEVQSLKQIGISVSGLVYTGKTRGSFLTGGESINIYEIQTATRRNCSNESPQEKAMGQIALLKRHGFGDDICVLQSTKWAFEDRAFLMSGNHVAVITTF